MSRAFLRWWGGPPGPRGSPWPRFLTVGGEMADFVDYYEMMQISPNAELATIQRVYRLLAARYHPDNPETGNTDQFVLLQKAYQVLSDPEARAQYDSALAQQTAGPMPVFEMKEFVVGIDAEMVAGAAGRIPVEIEPGT